MEGVTEHIASAAAADDVGQESSSVTNVAEQTVADTTVEKPAEKKSAPASAAPQPSVPVVEDRDPVEINIHTLLKAGVHFGHQTARWNPGMAPHIYTVRNGIHIINLPKTVQCWNRTRKAIVDVVARGGSVLFVGTKKQAQAPVIEEATRCGSFYVARRWLGGMMTNLRTIRNSIERMKKLETLLADEQQRTRYKKKELLMMDREREKLDYSLSGIRDMHGPPQMMFVVDTRREEIAVKEARRLDVPVVALVDTNSDPSMIDYPIPSNDDATRAIRLFCAAVADAVLEGKAIHAERARRVGKDQPEAEDADDAAAAASEEPEAPAAKNNSQ